MSHDGFDAGTNRVGALALRLADRMEIAVVAEGVRSVSAATALVALLRFFAEPDDDGPSIDALHRMLGITSSGAVRLVDTLVADGFVVRRPGSDARVTVLELTDRGRRAAVAAGAARDAVLTEALSPLTARERAALAPIVDKVLIALVQGPRPGPAMCRLCDTGSCGAQPGQPCPITQTALGLPPVTR